MFVQPCFAEAVLHSRLFSMCWEGSTVAHHEYGNIGCIDDGNWNTNTQKTPVEVREGHRSGAGWGLGCWKAAKPQKQALCCTEHRSRASSPRCCPPWGAPRRQHPSFSHASSFPWLLKTSGSNKRASWWEIQEEAMQYPATDFKVKRHLRKATYIWNSSSLVWQNVGF